MVFLVMVFQGTTGRERPSAGNYQWTCSWKPPTVTHMQPLDGRWKLPPLLTCRHWMGAGNSHRYSHAAIGWALETPNVTHMQPLALLPSPEHSRPMIASNDDIVAANETVLDPKPSYSLSRFLSDMDQNHPPGYGQARNPAESEERMQELLRSIEAKFSTSTDPPHRSDSTSRS
ncbi:hypothetical protein HDV62DRAFT_395597 [Trichoderma sp. SZMC 28011]